MARMYFDFQTNLKDTSNDFASAQVDFIAFENKERGFIISVACNDSSDWEIKDGKFSARFKGLECKIDNPLNHDYEEISELDIELLKESTPYEVGIYFPSNDSVIDEPVKIENLDVEIEYGDQKLSFHTDKCSPLEYGLEENEEEKGPEL